MKTFRFVLGAWMLALAAIACNATQPSGVMPGSALTTHAATAEPTPLGYFYSVNSQSNDVSQYAFTPGAQRPLTPLGSNLALPSGCSYPDGIAVAPSGDLAFVACFSGEIVALTITATHALANSGIEPVPVPSPLQIIAPATGAASELYADGDVGQIFALKYSANRLSLQKTYQTGHEFPDKMAFYTDAKGASTLYVAQKEQRTRCPLGGSSGDGAVQVWSQSRNGSLFQEPPIPECGPAYLVVQSGNALYWAGPLTLGEYLLESKKLVETAAPPWARRGNGPTYYPGQMNAIAGLTKPATAGDALSSGEFSVVTTPPGLVDAHIYIFKGGTTIASGLGSIRAANCFTADVTVGGKQYHQICFAISKDDLVLYVVDNDSVTHVDVRVPLGSGPFDSVFVASR
ncbi:MAG TPA: hypothetical protein VMH02_04335 [Verrucomicrobiae bacterium]|nr:hypothetical protein [Verrucomicrobiae bacterium]